MTTMKHVLIGIAMAAYFVAICGFGYIAGKTFYYFIHHQETFSWWKAILAGYIGLFVFAILSFPLHRYNNPKCPNCGFGRLQTRTEVLHSYKKPAITKLHYGIRTMQEFTVKIDHISCDKCDCYTTRQYETEEQVTIH